MMKIIGIAILSISAVLAGLLHYEKYNIRPSSLSAFLTLINGYYAELKLKRRTFEDRLKTFQSKDPYFITANQLLTDHGLSDAMITKNDRFESLCLLRDDRVILKYFFETTGKSSYKDEVALCQKTVEALEMQLADAKNTRKKSGSLSVKLGFIVAAWIAIILL